MNAKSTGPRLLVLTLLLSHAGATQDQDPTVQSRAQRSVDGLRSRQVKIDLDLLGDARGFWKSSRQGRQSLVLNLFADTTFTAILDRIRPHSRGYSWIGRVQGTKESIVILTVKNNVMAGNISVPGTSFQIRHSGADVYAVREVDPWAARPDGPAIEVDVESGESYQAGKLDDSGDHRRFPHSGDVTLAVSPSTQSFRQSSGSGSMAVATRNGCDWTAASSSSWITITSRSGGTGNGSVSYTVSPNPTTQTRSGTITAGTQVSTITQSRGKGWGKGRGKKGILLKSTQDVTP